VLKQVQGKVERDRHVIEAVVRRFGPVSRARIHELTDIRLSALSTLVRELLAEGRLAEAGVEASTLGRKGVLLQLNEGFGSVVGIEFDDESVTAGVTDLHPRIRHCVTEPVRLNGGVAGLVDQLVSLTRRALREAGVRRRDLIGIGVADPGLVDSQRGVTVTSSMIPFWKDVALREIFARQFRVPVLVEARTRAKAVAEHECKAVERPPDSMIYIDYGSGIGAGLYVDGRLLYGQGSAAGEFGHTAVSVGGPVCACGSFGCLEAVAGLRAVEARIRQVIHEGARTDVLEMAGGDVSRISGWMVFAAASDGDKAASNVVAEIARYLGLGLANLVNLFNPGLIVLDARLRVAGENLLQQVEGVVRRQALRESQSQVTIRYASVTEAAGVIGVVEMVLAKHFEVPAFRPPPFLVAGNYEERVG